MLTTIALFEANKRLRQLSTWIYFAVFFAAATLMMMASAGAFKSVNVSFGAGGKTIANSPVALHSLVTVFSYLGLPIAAAVLGQAVHQDFDAGAAPLFFTLPMKTWEYLTGRFAGAFAALSIVYTGIGLGFFAGTLMPGVEPTLLGPNRLVAYAWPYVVGVLPNALFTGAIFFSMAALTRNMRPVYVSSVILLVGWLIAGSLMAKIDNRHTAALLDPLGLEAVDLLTRYWPVAERNTRLLPLGGDVLENRLLWLAVGAATFAFTLRRFRFAHAIEGGRGGKPAPEPAASSAGERIEAVAAAPASPLHLLPGLTWLAFRETVKSAGFLVLVLAGVLVMILGSRNMGSLYGTPTHAVTYAVLEITAGSFGLFLFAITTYYAGELVWRERDAKMSQIADALPVPTWLPYLSKLAALCLVQALLLGVVMIASLGIQIAYGHFHFEIGLYLTELFANRLPRLFLMSAFAFAIQAVVDNKYLGYFAMVAYYVGVTFLPGAGLNHHLYVYGTVPHYEYSDMNGYGHFVRPIVWFDLYWAAAAVLLAIATNLAWVRGLEQGLRTRARIAAARFSRAHRAAAGAAALVFAGTGGFIYYNTNVLNHYRTSFAAAEIQAEAERAYKARENDPTPRIVNVTLACDLYPEERRMEAKGTYSLRNKTAEPITRLLVTVPEDAILKRLAVAGVDQPTRSDPRHGYHDFDLPKPLAPGEETTLDFELGYHVRGFLNEEHETNRLTYNGTFFDSGLFPHLGYQKGGEIDDDDVRRKHGLPPRPRMADLHDKAALRNNYVANDCDWMGLDVTLSTSADQIAIAPGDLVRQWDEGGRRHFHYTMARPILGFYAILSARYAVKRSSWNDVAIEIYYQPGHEYDIDRMIEGIQASLAYYTKNFSPYQHRRVRIVEFPRYESFAQSFPNTIPYSERIGFIAKVDPDDEEDVDYPYYITAHEVGHQWWAHQVIGGDVQGSTLLSETLAQYSALMVMKQKYGAMKMKRFLRYELDRYLLGRSTERKKELPLVRVENQPYIHYQKGSLAMYRLADRIGEDAVNRALSAFVQRYGYGDPPYPTSEDLVAYLREATPPADRGLIEDLFETITLYDNRATSATYVEKPDHTYEVRFTVTAKKLRADELGAEKEVPLDDVIDVGVLGKDGTPLWLEKRRITDHEATFTATVAERPYKAGIDPLNELVDRESDDNVVPVTKE
jgi:ABC-type transport system involved in multi-copper enzyme maturation permease subunit